MNPTSLSKYLPATQIHTNMSNNNKAVNASWADSVTLSLYPYAHKFIKGTQISPHFGNNDSINITHLKPKFIFESPVLRSLLAEANNIFHDLQDRAKAGLSQSEYLKISQSYRCIIRECLQKLQREAELDNETKTDSETQYEDYITVFYSIECIWHLCEIFLINTTSSNLVIPQLMEWVRFHFPGAEQRATELLMATNIDCSESDNDEYLRVVKALVVQGHLDVARTILQLYGRNNYNATFQMVDDTLKSVPIYNISGGLSLQNWRSQWDYWVTETQSKIQMGCFSAHPELEEIISLVTGCNKNWKKMMRESSCWYEHLPGFLYYTQPNCTYSQLGTFAEEWLVGWMRENGEGQSDDRTGSNLKHLDRVILMLMQNDFHQILCDIQNMCDQQWFATHLTDLLWHCGRLNILSEDHTEASGSLRDSLLLDFGSLLMSKDSFWEFGLGYLEQCSNEGIDAIEILLPKIVIRNEKQALKVVHVAKTRGLLDVEKEICRIQAVKSFKNERYGDALDWALRSQDNNTVSTITDFFLKHYVSTGEILCHDVISKAGPKMFISPRLVFLAKYFDFQNFYRNKQFPQAAELLVNLLDSKIAPGYFLTSLFADTIPILEAADPIFSTKETYKIMHYLETQLVLLLEKNEASLKRSEGDEEWTTNRNIREMVKLIRIACTRNLSRALSIENTQI